MLYVNRAAAVSVGIILLAATAITGCSRSQLRVTVPDPDQRPGTVTVTAFTSQTDDGRLVSHVFGSAPQAPANFVFTFEPRNRFAYMVGVLTSFRPAQPRPDECILTCLHLAELLPGHSHRIEAPIPILPHECSYYFPAGSSAREEATALCSAAAGIIRIPNCQFIVTGDHECTLVCPDYAPEDPAPDDPSDQRAAAIGDNGPPITAPAVSSMDAGFDSGAMDAGIDSVPGMDAAAPGPWICGGVDIDCDGLVDSWPCGAAMVCDNNQCVPPCVEGTCRTDQTCTLRGTCVDTACLSVTCGAGQRCRAGACVDACDGVTCASGEICRAGACRVPCPDR